MDEKPARVSPQSQAQSSSKTNGNPSTVNGGSPAPPVTSSVSSGTITTGPAVPISSNQQPSVKIGHYVLGDTLGVGTFGKVKSKFQIGTQITYCISCDTLTMDRFFKGNVSRDVYSYYMP